MRLGERTWTDLDRAAGPSTVLVPVGSLEQHGPHLPLDTDARIAAAVARRAADPDRAARPAAGVRRVRRARGVRGHAVDRPRRAAGGARRAGTLGGGVGVAAVFVNGHGGNLPTVPEAVVQLRQEGRDVAWFGCAVPGGDAHAGRTETAILLALDPSMVRMDAAEVGNTAGLRELMPALTSGGLRAASPNGVLGDPRGATADEGEELLAGPRRRPSGLPRAMGHPTTGAACDEFPAALVVYAAWAS